MGKKNKSIPAILFNLIIIFNLNSFIYCEENYTLSEIVAVQEANASEIQTMSAEVENEIEFNGKKQEIIYDYVLQNNADGSKKMMVTTKGVFTMQFLVDTKEGSVTYLMAEAKELSIKNYQFSIKR